MSGRATEPGVAALDGSVLRLEGVALGYAGAPVLEAVDLEVRRGERWFLLGPNGSGKTTLLRGILGLIVPMAGRLTRDRDLADRARIGFVPQRCDINPTLPTTVREFVSLGFVGSSVERSAQAGALAWALERMGLADRARVGLHALSGGQRQRALVARALVRRPRLLILDEPTEGLDIGSEEAFLAVLEDLNRAEGLTLLFVTHRLALAARHATHVALVHARHLHVGPRREVLGSEAVERVFGVRLDLDDATLTPTPGSAGGAQS